MSKSTLSQFAIELAEPTPEGARIRVIGVGGGGGNAINSMIKRGLSGVDFIAANTDAQALAANLAATKVQIGRELTRGLGAGADPTIGQLAVEESIDDIREALQHSDMMFVTAGMGGGTGTGGAPVIARIGRELDCLVVGIVTKPFGWEAKKRAYSAEMGINELRRHVDALIVIPNQKLMGIIDKNTSFVQAFQKVDDVLYNATKGIADIISGNGMVNVDFADVRTIMKNKGDALMGIGIARGENRAKDAALNAIQSPLLDGVSIHGAEGVLINITATSDVSMVEIGDAVQTIEEAAGDQANLIFGVVFNEDLGDQIMVTVVATGFQEAAQSGYVHETETVQNTQRQAVVEHQHVAAHVTMQVEQKIAANGGSIHMPAQFSNAVSQQQAQQAQPVAHSHPAIIAHAPAAPPQQAGPTMHQHAAQNSYQQNSVVMSQPTSQHVPQQQHSQAHYQPVQHAAQRAIPQAAPVGHSESSKYDAPAFTRRHGSVPLSPSTAAETETRERAPLEKPAFLRKIMD